MAPFFRKMETRRLQNSDIKKIVYVLRDHPTRPAGDEQEKSTEKAIKKLPRRLRSAPLSSHGALCGTHRGLDAHLIGDIWAWIKYELEVAIGRFLYPIIMSNVLSEQDERRARQLEPVVRMFNPDWTLAGSPPPGVLPIDAGDKWAFQKNGCPGCMLARLGSDEDALFALFAGMYGHLRSRAGGQKGVDKIKSKRLRFVRYWMRTYPHGGQKSLGAYDLGVEMKGLRFDAKTFLRQSGQHARYPRGSTDGRPSVATRHCFDEQPGAVMDPSGPDNPKDWTVPNNSKIGPEPPFDPTKQFIIEGWNNKSHPSTPRASVQIQPPRPRTAQHSHQLSTHSIEDDELPPLPVLSRTNLKRRDSVLSSASTHRPPGPASSIYSSPSRLTIATTIASFNNDLTTSSHAHRYDPMESAEERADKYRKLLDQTPINLTDQWGSVKGGKIGKVNVGKGMVEFNGRLLPKPSHASIYSAFGEEGRDGAEFEQVDVSPPPSPVMEGMREENENEEEEDVDDDDGAHVDMTPLALRKQE